MNKIKLNYKEPLGYYKMGYYLKDVINKDTIIICIGTDRCIGDALGPWIGTMLKERRFPLPVYGTLEEPVHALNLHKRLDEIKKMHPRCNVLAIDACLGDSDCIGELQVRDYPLHPGKGVGKSLPDLGDYSIIGIVDSSDNNELFSNRAIRMNQIHKMSRVVTDGILHGYYLWSNKEE